MTIEGGSVWHTLLAFETFNLYDDLLILNPSIYVHNNLQSFLLLVSAGSSVENYQTPMSPDLLSAQSLGLFHLPRDNWVLHFVRDAKLGFARNISVMQPPMLQQNNKVDYASLSSYLSTKCVCGERKIEDKSFTRLCLSIWVGNSSRW